ncbi:MAG: UPF0182 family protein [Anaerolineae bacterium]|nr:UPF0182 family protein [Anaerolineae bacterium]
MKKQARLLFVLIGVAVCVFFVLPFVSLVYGTLYTDWLWFDSLGYLSVYRTRIFAEAGLFAVGGVLAAGFILLNWLLIPSRLTRRLEVVLRPYRKTVALDSKGLTLVLIAAALFLALPMALLAASHAMDVLVASHAAPFGLQDPIFGLDVGFYIFKLPFYNTLVGWLIGLVITAGIGTGLLYLMSGALGQRGPVAHLSILGALFLLLLAVNYQLQRLSLLDSARGVVFGAGYTDVHARLPMLHVLTAISVVGAVILLANIAARRWRLLIGAVAVWLVAVLVSSAYPAIVQRFVVNPNELANEWPYIEHNIAFTRYAFGLNDVYESDFSAEGTLDQAVLDENAATIANIRLWDWRPLQTTYEQLQEIRLYYTFVDVDVDRYVIDGQIREVTLAARELDVDQLPGQAQTWVNRHLIYTHGYGVCLSPVSEVNPEGLPNFLVRDIPPQSSAAGLDITRPEIYFGEETDNYIIVGTAEQELDRPSGDANVYTQYEGPDGVRMGGFFRRLAFTLRFGDQQILFSGSIDPQSRILFYRDVAERVAALAPMFWYDPDPYIVIADGRLVWLYDAYTTSERFPYSEPFGSGAGDINYVRNSVKVAIDAYTGETTFYVVDPSDPVMLTYQAIFPDLFAPASEMDPSLREHWRYPEQLFRLQAEAYAAYHMDDPQVFYNKEDLWAVPTEMLGSEEEPMAPYYVVMRLPGEDEVEFIMIRPYVPSGRHNMIAWLYADSDGADYGQLGVFKFSKEGLLYGPMQVEARFDQDPYISQQLSLWNQRGSQVYRGNLIVIPIDDTILYVEPLYLQAQSGGLPELKRVLLAYGNHVVMAEDLSTALAQVLGVPAAVEPLPGEEPIVTDVAELARSAQAHYDAAQLCLIQGDWACYGSEMEAMAADLETLIQVTEPPTEAEP